MNELADDATATAPPSSPLPRWSALVYSLLLLVITFFTWANLLAPADLSTLAYLYFGWTSALSLLFAIPGTALLWGPTGPAIVRVFHLACAVVAVGYAGYWTFLSGAGPPIVYICWVPAIALVLTVPSTLWRGMSRRIMTVFGIPCAAGTVLYLGMTLYVSVSLTAISLACLAPSVAVAIIGFRHATQQPDQTHLPPAPPIANTDADAPKGHAIGTSPR